MLATTPRDSAPEPGDDRITPEAAGGPRERLDDEKRVVAVKRFEADEAALFGWIRAWGDHPDDYAVRAATYARDNLNKPSGASRSMAA